MIRPTILAIYAIYIYLQCVLYLCLGGLLRPTVMRAVWLVAVTTLLAADAVCTGRCRQQPLSVLARFKYSSYSYVNCQALLT
jgi:hypothetical protein